MLQQIGDGLKGHKWLTYVVFGALALIFAAWGAYGVANLNFGSSSLCRQGQRDTIPYEDVRAPGSANRTSGSSASAVTSPPASARCSKTSCWKRRCAPR